jgi:hypothetical protein
MTAVIDQPSAGAQPDEAHRGASYWREVVATVLLSLATLGSTWSAYQAALWSSHQATRFSEASTARTRSEGAATRAVQLASLDAGMFIEYVMAVADHRDQVARFLFKRFRPEMKVAVDAWLATRPLENPQAPPSPFAMAEYSLDATRQSRQLGDEADLRFEEARRANQTSDKYVLLTVVFTTVLFFAGIGQKLWRPRTMTILLSIGGLLFLVGAVILSSLPRL